MASKMHNLHKGLEAFEESAEAVGMDLRLDFAEIVLRRMQEMKLNQKQLAEKIDMKEPQLTKLLHSDANCTVDTMGRVLHAMGIRATLVRQITAEPFTVFAGAQPPKSVTFSVVGQPPPYTIPSTRQPGMLYGKQEKISLEDQGVEWRFHKSSFNRALGDEAGERGAAADYAPSEQPACLVG